MFGPILRIAIDDRFPYKDTVYLRPFNREEMDVVARGMSNPCVTQFTRQQFGQTLESEQAWYDNVRESQKDVIWAIALDNNSPAIGVTGLHGLDLHGSCTSGIIIWNSDMWGKGVATASHLARTLYAAYTINRFTIKSAARVENEASRKALERVGYMVTGKEYRTGFYRGKFADTYSLCWFHPERTALLFPEGIPSECLPAINRAQTALDKARQLVKY